ncbi:voltage-dependent calcium channel gamma-1 subunit [Elysia marginata]|uniref:Voltage-dependent calcium channel gamma-1 subunit n=1 Tax=Elysia marginata TaxID=1093978 RepID=A0AAV4JM74_9GAST|nr:voltage-dependent calcium channel gamma-1 subunit [Elysia marginata]
MTSHNSSTRSAHGSVHGSVHDSPRTTSSSTRKTSSRRKASTGGSSRRGRAMPQRQHRSRSTRAMKWLEPRLLLITTGVTLFGALLQVVAISTDSWLVMKAGGRPSPPLSNMTTSHVAEAYMGLWRFCRVEVKTRMMLDGTLEETSHESCQPHNLFPSKDEVQQSTEYERHHLDYTRTAIAFTIIALVIMVIGHAFAFYALRRPRYIIKRLAALLHLMTAACLLVLNEVFVKTAKHEKEKMADHVPQDGRSDYGYSFVLSWLVFVIFVLAGLIFLFTSHKKKAEYADGTEALEDEPMEIRR